MLLKCSSLFVVLALVFPQFAWSQSGGIFEKGDRVVFLGNTLIEREQEYGGWELPLTLATADKDLIVRNLGWSGDTVWTESRGVFDPPAAGYQRTLELVKELKPSVIILGYGNVEAFGGPSKLPPFREQYQKLVNDLASVGARFVHLSPILLEKTSLPDQSEARLAQTDRVNQSIEQYAGAIREIAGNRQELFVDLIDWQRSRSSEEPLTQNGIHFSADGYLASGLFLTAQLTGKTLTQENLASDSVENLRLAIIDKNRLFFHRWRPQNITYLFLFRKHEQGNNAVEVAQFDPFVDKAEESIAKKADRIAESWK
ncbi:MAG: hypothetical protein KDA36_12645 [Planctomycetaceae bacterium]|nr:hypothetical protein [Planctomycetaceae bacterium]